METDMEEVDGFMEEEGVYCSEILQELLDADEINSFEEAFMVGYIEG